MTADAHAGDDSGGAPFETVDPKLTIYALANAMDLDKEGASRRLSWFREGLERGVLLEAGPEGSLAVSALAWKTGDESTMTRASVVDAVAAVELPERLSELLETAVEAANDL